MTAPSVARRRRIKREQRAVVVETEAPVVEEDPVDDFEDDPVDDPVDDFEDDFEDDFVDDFEDDFVDDEAEDIKNQLDDYNVSEASEWIKTVEDTGFLDKVAEVELANKNRVSVLRAVKEHRAYLTGN